MTASDLASLGALKTGDLVLFAGESGSPGLLRWFRRNAWTHVGLVLRGREDAEPWLWEAGSAGPGAGTVLVRLAARIARHRGRMSARGLNRALAERQCARLEALRAEIAGRPARRGLLDLIGAADDGWLGARREALADPMDAELVAAAYQRIGLLDDVAHGGAPASRYRPWQFGERYGLELKDGFALGPELALRGADRAFGRSDASPQPAAFA
jgi:hypothetical protein